MLRPLQKSLLLVPLLAIAGCEVPGEQAPEGQGSSSVIGEAGGPNAQPAPAPGEGLTRRSLDVGVDANGAPVCSGDLAADTFRYGLCVCGDLAMAGELKTSSFSSSDPDGADGSGGGVGVNGRYASSGGADIGGSLVVAGDVTPVGDYRVAGELRAGRRAAPIGSMHVEADAYVAGSLTAIGLAVDGTLHTTSAISGFGVQAGATAVSDFEIAPPCGCDDVLDIAGFVAAAASDNDNDAAGLSADALDGVAGGSSVSLPSGRYYLSRLAAAGDIELRLSGPTALYVGDDVSLAGRLAVVFENEGAELDLFIGGNLAHAGQLELGSADAPARVRTYVAGGGTIALAGSAELGGALYAPEARLAAAGELSFAGAVLVGSLADAGRVTVRYDAELQVAAEGCEEEPGEGDLDDGDLDDGDLDDGDLDDGLLDEGDLDDGDLDDGDLDDGDGDEGGLDDGDGVDPEGPAACETFMDCPDPQVCIEGGCYFIDG